MCSLNTHTRTSRITTANKSVPHTHTVNADSYTERESVCELSLRVDGDSDASTNMRKQPVTRADQRKHAENSRWETERETARRRKRSVEEERETGRKKWAAQWDHR